MMHESTALAQLRHLYAHMISGRMLDPVQAARGLLGPAIEALETARRERADRPTMPALPVADDEDSGAHRAPGTAEGGDRYG